MKGTKWGILGPTVVELFLFSSGKPVALCGYFEKPHRLLPFIVLLDATCGLQAYNPALESSRSVLIGRLFRQGLLFTECFVMAQFLSFFFLNNKKKRHLLNLKSFFFS